MKKRIVGGIFLSLLLFCAGCATINNQVGLHGGVLPDRLKLSEKDILEDAQKVEDFLYKSGAVYEEEPELEAYINEVGKKMVPQELNAGNIEFKFKILRDPALNAFAMPHGRIYVTTGLLSSLENEAQLAFVLGHEIAHVMNRDLLYFVESCRSKTATAKVFDLILTPAAAVFGAGLFSEIGVGLIYRASVTGYGREQETQADTDGFKKMKEVGYELTEAERVSDIFMAEGKKYDTYKTAVFLRSHPTDSARKEAIHKLIGSVEGGSGTAVVNNEKFKELTKKARTGNAALNIKLGRYYHALENLEKLLEENLQDAAIYCYRGECYRLMASNRSQLKDELSKEEWEKIKKVKEEAQKTEWQDRAEQEYKLALSYDKNYADVYRGLGFLYETKGKKDEAITYLQMYLDNKIDAKDKRFVASSIERLKKPVEKETKKSGKEI